MQGIGHNFLPLHERIFSDPEVSVEDVLMAVSTHLEISHKTNLEQLASTSTMLASNKDRIPEDFDERHIGSALNLLSHVDEHGSKIAETRSDEHTSELQSLMRISYAVFCLKKKTSYTKTSDINII